MTHASIFQGKTQYCRIRQCCLWDYWFLRYIYIIIIITIISMCATYISVCIIILHMLPWETTISQVISSKSASNWGSAIPVLTAALLKIDFQNRNLFIAIHFVNWNGMTHQSNQQEEWTIEVMWYMCYISADPDLRQGRGGAWDHRRCGTFPRGL